MDLSPWEILNSRGYAVWMIAGFSVIAMAVALERAAVLWNFMSRARALADTVTRCLTRGALDESRSACERSRSPLADVFLVGYERLGRTKPANVDSAVHRERVRVAAQLKNRLWIIGTTGATAPFVGLYGTVFGILFGFNKIQAAEDRGESGIGVVSGYIYEALWATALGIIVAVIAVITYNYFNQRLARVAMELKMLTEEFLEQLHECEPSDERASKRGKKQAEETDEDGARNAA